MTDIEIAENAKALPIKEVAKALSIKEEELILYGNLKAKVIKEVDKCKGKLILVTAINPTAYGEGKTTVSIGLADALKEKGERVSLSLRQPSLGPVFGLKGGATGGGYSQVIPMTDINLHFTGDFHAITSCNNLISAAIYNHIEKGNELGFKEVLFERCLDVNDRSLRHIKVNCNNSWYNDSFRITSASEVMALFSLATSLTDLKKRLANILVGLTEDLEPITVHDLKLEGALVTLLKDAFNPNLVQTLYNTPSFIHGGPFANIAHGCSSVRATKLALSLSDYVVTEAGFGADLGAEKFLNLVCPTSGLKPSAIVLVVTIRALLHNGDNDIIKGLANLEANLSHLLNYGVGIVVAINHFENDKDSDIKEVINYCTNKKVKCVVTKSYSEGSKGALDLALAVVDICNTLNNYQPIITEKMNVEEKMQVLGKIVYHAKEIIYEDKALKQLELINKLNLSHLPICVSKTQYSISDDAKKLGFPKDNIIHVKDIKINLGASFLTIMLGDIIAMPGLPKHPNYEKIDVVNDQIIGLF